MPKKNYAIILLFLLLSMLTLAACERPIPREEPADTPAAEGDEAESEEPVIQPELLPEQPVESQEGETTAPIEPSDPNSPTSIAPEPTAAPAQDTIHIVQSGETLGTIAEQYGVTIEEIAVYNNIEDANFLDIDQELKIPAPGTVDLTAPTAEPTAEALSPEATVESPEGEPAPPAAADNTHVVQAGENLYRIGLKYGCTVEQMATHNGIVNPARINIGQVLDIPTCN